MRGVRCNTYTSNYKCYFKAPDFPRTYDVTLFSPNPRMALGRVEGDAVLPKSRHMPRVWQGSRCRYVQFLGGACMLRPANGTWRYTLQEGMSLIWPGREATPPDKRDKFRWVQTTRDRLMFKGLCRGHSWEVLAAF